VSKRSRPTIRPPSPGEEVVDALGWAERYGTHSKTFGGFRLVIEYSPIRSESGFRMSINGTALKGTKPTYIEAREHVVDVARKWARKSLEFLDAEYVKIKAKASS
jgi:hypothetical protein